MAIETLLELGEVSIKELVGRLKAAEERYVLTGEGVGVAQLNLTEDELVARISNRLQVSTDKGSGSGGSSGSQQRGRSGGRDKAVRGGRQKGADDASREKRRYGGARSSGRDVARDKCRYCGTVGRWAKECPKRCRDAAHLA
jgi:hypothetical protein